MRLAAPERTGDYRDIEPMRDEGRQPDPRPRRVDVSIGAEMVNPDPPREKLFRVGAG